MSGTSQDAYVAFRAELRVLRAILVALLAERRAVSGAGVAWLAKQRKLAMASLGPIDPTLLSDTEAAAHVTELFDMVEMVASAFEEEFKIN